MNVLIIGSGGREHAIAWKISQSTKLTKLFIAPGNAGTDKVGENINISVNDFESIKQLIIEKKIKLLIVGPEEPLVNGIYDFFKNIKELSHLMIIGPSKLGAKLEGSKEWAKNFMVRHNIPTAKYKSFSDNNLHDAIQYLNTINPPYVLKADGLAAGKGVLIINSKKEAEEEIQKMFNGKFGSAGKTIVLEEFLSGIELSVFVLTDGKDYLILPEAKDYKRIGKGDTGLNTGGMGSVSPVPFADKKFMQKIEENIIKPTINGLYQEKIEYRGFIFFGLIKVAGDPFVIEYNVRMGDPETESVIPRIKNDLLDMLIQLSEGKLNTIDLEINPESVATVMMVSGGYPEDYKKGYTITFPEQSESIIFHAGTKKSDNSIVTNGGRVLAISSFGINMKDALKNSYDTIKKINFKNSYYRPDIGFDL